MSCWVTVTDAIYDDRFETLGHDECTLQIWQSMGHSKSGWPGSIRGRRGNNGRRIDLLQYSSQNIPCTYSRGSHRYVSAVLFAPLAEYKQAIEE